MTRLAFAILVVLCGCAPAPQSAPIALFPDATEVRVFGGVDFIHQKGDGTIVGYRFVGRAVDKDVPATDGGLLSRDEIALLRKSFDAQAAPPLLAMCCTPRHAFVFYDDRHRQIGYLEICFECGCADLSPRPARNPSLPYLNWDRKALTRIVDAHHLPPLPKRD